MPRFDAIQKYFLKRNLSGIENNTKEVKSFLEFLKNHNVNGSEDAMKSLDFILEEVNNANKRIQQID